MKGEILNYMKIVDSFEEIKLLKNEQHPASEKNVPENGEVYSDYLDSLTVIDLMKLTTQGFKIVTSNGHIIAIIPEHSDLLYGIGYFMKHCMQQSSPEE